MNIKNKIQLILISAFFIIPITFDTNLLNHNILHNFVFSVLLFLFSVIILFFSKKLPGINYKYFIIPALFLITMFLSSIFNNKMVLFFPDFFKYLSFFIFTFLIYHSDIKSKIQNISIVILTVGVIISLIGILQLYDINILGLINNTREGSTLGNRNFVSEYLTAVLPLSLFVVFRNNNEMDSSLIPAQKHCRDDRNAGMTDEGAAGMTGRNAAGITNGRISRIEKCKEYLKWYAIFSATVIVSYLLLCRTRIVYISLAMCLLIFVVLIIKYRINFNYKKIISTVFIIIIISLFSGLLSPPNIDKNRKSLIETFSSLTNYNLPENEARIGYFTSSMNIIKDNPILGIGTGSWFGIYPKYVKDSYSDENILNTTHINPHNDFLEIFSEMGILGGVFWISIILTSLIRLYKKSKTNLHMIPYFLSFISILTISFFAFPKENISVMILFFFIMGISLPKKTEKPGFNKFSLILISILIIITLVFNFKRYYSEKEFIKAMSYKSIDNYKIMLEELSGINNCIYPTDVNKMPLDYYRGVGYFELKDYENALKYFNSASNLMMYNPAILSNKASAYYMSGKSNEAIELLIYLKNSFPYYYEPQINLLSIYTNLKSDSLSIKLIKELDYKIKQHKFIRNYSLFQKIKDYYHEKDIN